jgi:hypothetical protein
MSYRHFAVKLLVCIGDELLKSNTRKGGKRWITYERTSELPCPLKDVLTFANIDLRCYFFPDSLDTAALS